MYQPALDAGIAPEKFWDYSIAEINDLIDAYQRRRIAQRKAEITDQFINAEVVASLISIGLSGDKNARYPRPWDYYPELFKAEKEEAAEITEQDEVAKAYESRRRYGEVWNRRFRETHS